MITKKVNEKGKLVFNKQSSHPLQSWEWGEFRKAWGNEVLFTKHGLLTLHKIPFTEYKVGMFIKGPEPNQEMLTDLKNLAKEKNLIFIKLEPNVKKDEKLVKMMKNAGAILGKTLFTPTTFWVDLTKSEDELLKSFSSKTRYNIRVALKHKVEVVEDNSNEAFERYIKLTRETVERQRFYAHTEKYHRLMWQYLHQTPLADHQPPIARLLTARYKKEIITAWVLFVWHDFLYYPYGASSDKYKNVMANNLVMWEAIRFGKKLGLTTFDLWGREEGKGFTKFKEGYNPQVVEFLGTWDLITSRLYRPYRLAESLRWIILKAQSKFVKPTF